MAGMNRLAWLGYAAIALVIGCGSDGATGPAGTAGPAGPPGPEGTEGRPGEDGTGEPSVSAVTPGRAFLERRIDVTISGYGTEWSATTEADFGPGITVDEIRAASPTALVATITVDAAAALGSRDVTVMSGDASVVYADAFRVEAPLAIPGYAGTLAQGSVIYARLEQLDASTPFDTLSLDNLLFYAGDSSPGLYLVGANDQPTVDPYHIDGLLFLDVNASTGPTEVVVESGLPGGEITSRAPAVFDAEARAPIALAAGAPATGAVTEPLQTHLYSFTATPNTQVTLSVNATDPAAVPGFMLLPESGKFSDLIEYTDTTTFSAGAGGTWYLVFWDNSGATGYDFTFEATEVVSDDEEPNNTCMTAQAITLPASLSTLSLPDATDEDWFEVTVDASAVGSSLRVVTSPGDADTDTVVDVLLDDCVTSLGGPSPDTFYFDSLTSAPIPAAGTYFVKVSYSTFGFTSPGYNLSVALVPAPGPETEPNDDSATATPAAIGQTFQATLGVAGDQDYFAVTVPAGATILATVGDGAVDTCGSAGDIDSEVEIYDIDGTTSLAYNDDAGFGYYCSATSATVSAAGTYYVRAAGSAAYCADCTYDYSVTIDVTQ